MNQEEQNKNNNNDNNEEHGRKIGSEKQYVVKHLFEGLEQIGGEGIDIEDEAKEHHRRTTKEGSLFCFVIMGSTEPGCFRLCP
jgi:hypothetical protein